MKKEELIEQIRLKLKSLSDLIQSTRDEICVAIDSGQDTELFYNVLRVSEKLNLFI